METAPYLNIYQTRDGLNQVRRVMHELLLDKGYKYTQDEKERMQKAMVEVGQMVDELCEQGISVSALLLRRMQQEVRQLELTGPPVGMPEDDDKPKRIPKAFKHQHTQVLEFSQNWNNKLDCDAFTTVRQYNIEKQRAGTLFLVVLKKEPVCLAKVIRCMPMRLQDINDALAFVDCGHNAEYLRSVLRTMYKHKVPNLDTAQFAHLTLQVVER